MKLIESYPSNELFVDGEWKKLIEYSLSHMSDPKVQPLESSPYSILIKSTPLL